MLRDAIAAILILSILGAVVGLGVSGILHILLLLAAALLSLVLVRRRPAAASEKGSER